MAAPANLVELLSMRAAGSGDATGYSFLGDGERETATLGFARLDRAARVIAGRLGQLARPSSHVILAYPPGLDFIAAFFGCMHAGLVPVPVALPHPRKESGRLTAIAADCNADLVLSNDAGVRILQAVVGAGGAVGLRTAATSIDAEGEGRASPASAAPDDVAFLQYTSGSTRAPRGVRVTHANVLANLAAIQETERTGPRSRGVSWLPAHHDMGLIEGILQPLYADYPTTLLPHTAFLQRPVRWLRAISRLRATVSGGPNFAFDACVRRIGDGELEGLDLSHWDVAYCGAEPIRAETLTAFARRFDRCGLRASALRPVFGLAEATLLVSASDADAPGPRMLEVSRAALDQGRFVHAVADEAARLSVSCGRPAPGVDVRIVDPKTYRSLPQGEVGEIWVSGPGVADGYHGPASRSAEVFVDGECGGIASTWLRTGDLGCLHEGELHVTGRIKDVVIVRGRKLHPQDIEHGVQRLDPHRIVAVAAFGCQAESGEGVAVLVEVAARSGRGEMDGQSWLRLADEIRAEVYREHDVALAVLAFVPQGALARTTSGKLMRHRCSDDHACGRMPVIASFVAPVRTALSVEAA